MSEQSDHDAPEEPPRVVEVPINFSVSMKGYESHVTVDGADPKRAGELVTDWLEFQLRYLGTIKPGETVMASR